MKLKLRQWVFDKTTSAKQIAILPNLDVFWDYNPKLKENVWVVCISVAWLAWCLELWINPSKDLV